MMYCARCGMSLSSGVFQDNDHLVEPCATCLEEAREESRGGYPDVRVVVDAAVKVERENNAKRIRALHNIISERRR